MVTAKRAKWWPAFWKKRNSTPSSRKLSSPSSAIPAPSTALATSPSNTPSAPKPASTAPASPNTPAPSKPSPTSSSTANPNFECGSSASAFAKLTTPSNLTTSTRHPERIRQGCAKDLSLKYLHRNLTAQLPIAIPAARLSFPQLTGKIQHWRIISAYVDMIPCCTSSSSTTNATASISAPTSFPPKNSA